MNRIFLVLTLLVSGFVFSQDETEQFPIKLTCEVGSEIFFLHVGETKEDTWIRADSSSFDKPITTMTLFYGERWKEKVFSQRDKHRILGNNRIYLYFGAKGWGYGMIINRVSGRITIPTPFHLSGTCSKGFKEYKNKKF